MTTTKKFMNVLALFFALMFVSAPAQAKLHFFHRSHKSAKNFVAPASATPEFKAPVMAESAPLIPAKFNTPVSEMGLTAQLPESSFVQKKFIDRSSEAAIEETLGQDCDCEQLQKEYQEDLSAGREPRNKRIYPAVMLVKPDVSIEPSGQLNSADTQAAATRKEGKFEVLSIKFERDRSHLTDDQFQWLAKNDANGVYALAYASYLIDKKDFAESLTYILRADSLGRQYKIKQTICAARDMEHRRLAAIHQQTLHYHDAHPITIPGHNRSGIASLFRKGHSAPA